MEADNGDTEKLQLKCASVEAEYAELQKESLEITALLRKAKQAKRVLRGEVRFLRQRLKIFEKIASAAVSNDTLKETVQLPPTANEHTMNSNLELIEAGVNKNHIDYDNCTFFVATNTNYIDLDEAS